jgi:hypothetical protein
MVSCQVERSSDQAYALRKLPIRLTAQIRDAMGRGEVHALPGLEVEHWLVRALSG